MRFRLLKNSIENGIWTSGSSYDFITFSCFICLAILSRSLVLRTFKCTALFMCSSNRTVAAQCMMISTSSIKVFLSCSFRPTSGKTISPLNIVNLSWQLGHSFFRGSKHWKLRMHIQRLTKVKVKIHIIVKYKKN